MKLKPAGVVGPGDGRWLVGPGGRFHGRSRRRRAVRHEDRAGDGQQSGAGRRDGRRPLLHRRAGLRVGRIRPGVLIGGDGRAGCDESGREQGGHACRLQLVQEHGPHDPFCQSDDRDRDHPGRQRPSRPRRRREPGRGVRERGRHRRSRRLRGEQRHRERGRGGQDSSRQSDAQPFPTACQSALDRPERPAQLLRRLLLSQALQAAEHDRRAVVPGESGELFMDHRAEVIPGTFGHDLRPRLARLHLVRATPYGGRPGGGRDVVRHAVEPGGQRIPPPDRSRLAGQDEEGGLEGVLGVVHVTEHAPADAEDHRPVSFHQRGEGQLGGLAVAGREPVEQLPVGQPADRPRGEQRVDRPEGGPAAVSGHRPLPPRAGMSPIHVV